MPESAPATPEAFQQQLDDLHEQLRERNDTIAQLERRQRIDALLAEANPIDLPAARLLTEAAVQQMSEPDLRQAVDDLRRDKPWLFQHRAVPTANPLAPEPVQPPDPAEEAAAQAAVTGHQRDLLAYLRLRRQRRTRP